MNCLYFQWLTEDGGVISQTMATPMIGRYSFGIGPPVIYLVTRLSSERKAKGPRINKLSCGFVNYLGTCTIKNHGVR